MATKDPSQTLPETVELWTFVEEIPRFDVESSHQLRSNGILTVDDLWTTPVNRLTETEGVDEKLAYQLKIWFNQFDVVPGIGQKKKDFMMQQNLNGSKLCYMTEDELEAKYGIGPTTAHRLIEIMNPAETKINADDNSIPQ